jgi:hypothetical protein
MPFTLGDETKTVFLFLDGFQLPGILCLKKKTS